MVACNVCGDPAIVRVVLETAGERVRMESLAVCARCIDQRRVEVRLDGGRPVISEEART